jgi:hypothetical protein
MVDDSGVTFIPGSRIGCFGPGGNLAPSSVTHVNFFSQPETVDFLTRALSGQAHPLAPVEPSKSLPDRRLLRSGASVVALTPGGAVVGTPGAAPIAAPAESSYALLDGAAVVSSDAFHLVVLPLSEKDNHHSQIFAHYGSARVLEDFYLGGSNLIRCRQALANHHQTQREY